MKPSQISGTVKPSFGEMLKDDLKMGAYRAAGDQVTRISKEALIKALKNSENEHAQTVVTLLESKLGDSVMAGLSGYALTYAPVISEDERAQKLAAQLRQKGFADVYSLLFETFMSSIAPALQSVISGLPKEGEEDVEEEASESEETTDEEEQVEEKVTAKQGKA